MTKAFESINWLITGGCGFLGSSLIARLLRDNPETKIRVLDNYSVGTKNDLQEAVSFMNRNMGPISDKIQFVEGDIRDYNTCNKCCKDIDVIVHLAANTGVAPSVENPRYDMETNVIGTFNMLEGAREHNIKKFIFASSGATIGEVEPPIHEEQVQKPVSPYGTSKLVEKLTVLLTSGRSASKQ